MLKLSENISESDRKEVERRLKALERPTRKPVENRGFDKPSTYGLTFPYRAQAWGATYARRQEELYRWVMNENDGKI